MTVLETHTEKETIALGTELARTVGPGDTIALFGDLGSGKTRLIQGVCRGLGVKEHVASPTFTILRQYVAGQLTIYHFDFYRLKSLSEVREIGFEEYISGDGICLIEWADRVRELLPPRRFDISMKLGSDPDTRIIAIDELLPVNA